MFDSFDPILADWFRSRFLSPTEPQLQGWPAIRAGQDVLITAPTGSGKTLAAFLIALDGLVRRARAGELSNQIDVLYVSPLKALSHDVNINLSRPLEEVGALAAERGIEMQPIRTAVRTGDTRAWERQQIVGTPPHILVTTPESLFILLTTTRGRKALATVGTVIVDEIHAVADDKRGSHLALTLARLDALIRRNGHPRPQRIGLSATVEPVEAVASFLGDNVRIVEVARRRQMDIAVEVPRDELGAVASHEMWDEINNRVSDLARQHRTTLVFVNTRRLAERMAHQLAAKLGEGAVLPHHGSLSRKLRLDAEQRLKSGQLRVVVATASLELGIDIGTIDLVCQIGSPRAIATALQRIGRAGHWVGAMPKGRLFATTRDELVECAAVVQAIRSGELDRVEVPRAPLDILAQQIVAEAACDEWDERELLATIRKAYPFRDLSSEDFNAVVEMLSDGIATSRGRSGAFLHRDRVNGQIKGRRGARLAAVTSGGAIPDNANYLVVAEPEGNTVGTVDEDFAVESMAGDVFLLGSTSWKIRRVEQGRIRVEDAHGAAPNIPFWRGEAPGRTFELSEQVSDLRVAIADRARDRAAACVWLENECAVDRLGAEQLIDYAAASRNALGVMPSQGTVVAERFFDEAGGMQLILHAPFGMRINRAWGLALRKRFCRSFNLELQAAANDNGIVISLTEGHSFPLDAVFEFLKTPTLEKVLIQAMLPAPLFTARWRWNCSRALAVLRFAGGRKVPPQIQRMRAEDLMAAVFPDQAACPENLTGEVRIPNHPLVRQTIDDCLHEAMDLDGLARILNDIHAGKISTVAIETAEPSPLAHEILNSNPYAYLDDAPLEERRARAVQLRRSLPVDEATSFGALDPQAIRQVSEESWPLVRNADELHDALLTLTVLPPVPEWNEHFESLVAARRAGQLVRPSVASRVPLANARGSEALILSRDREGAVVKHNVGQDTRGQLWVAAERAALALAAYPDGVFDPKPGEVSATAPESQEECAALIAGGWLESIGPVTAAGLASRLLLPVELIESALARLEAHGQVLRGRFTPGLAEDVIEWANRRVLARIHRLTLGRLRREIEPATTNEFIRFLCRWQHVEAGTQLHGVDGLMEVIGQLQAYELPAAAWESDILPRRVAKYGPDLLDRLCLAGEVVWGRFSPHPALERVAPEESTSRRVRPNRVAPLALFRRVDAGALAALSTGTAPADPSSLSHVAREVAQVLRTQGASFFNELTHSTHRLASEVEDGLWELVAAGLVTGDGFENLRALVDPKRRRGEGRGRYARPRHAAGRWALLRFPPVPEGAPTPAEACARQLLKRWGVVCRDLLARESLTPPWRDLLVVLRRMEARGEVRGGRFVAALLGEQFALPEAVDVLRSVRRSAPLVGEIHVSAADPLNLAGIVLPGARVSPLSGERVRLLAISDAAATGRIA